MSYSIFVNAQMLEKHWSTERVLKTPESVLYNSVTTQIYVSNINGKPTDKDGNGFISLLDTTGKIIALKWITGFDAPKGMAVLHDSLFITDIDKVRIVSISRAKIIETIAVKGATFLNDIVVTEDGTAYISDTEQNKIYIMKNGQAETWLEDELLENPNGMLLIKHDLLAIGVKDGILKVNLNAKNVRKYMDGTGPVDGLVLYGNKKYVISNWSGRLLLVSADEKVVLYNKETDEQTADLGYIPETKILLIPTFYGNRVVATRIQRKVTTE